MTHIFFDDSQHERGDFVLGAYACFDTDPAEHISSAIQAAGFTPGFDEYKSSHPHARDPRWVELRRALFRIANASTIGIVVAPYADRSRFALHALTGLAHIIGQNDVARPIRAFLDEGLFRSRIQFDRWRYESGLQDNVEVISECDSRTVYGIQVADLVAHACAITLLGRLGIADKTLHSEEEGEYQLSFEMWARLRYNFFTRAITDPDLLEAARAGLVDSHGGLYVTPGTSDIVAATADERFGHTWLGCIH